MKHINSEDGSRKMPILSARSEALRKLRYLACSKSAPSLRVSVAARAWPFREDRDLIGELWPGGLFWISGGAAGMIWHRAEAQVLEVVERVNTVDHDGKWSEAWLCTEPHIYEALRPENRVIESANQAIETLSVIVQKHVALGRELESEGNTSEAEGLLSEIGELCEILLGELSDVAAYCKSDLRRLEVLNRVRLEDEALPF